MNDLLVIYREAERKSEIKFAFGRKYVERPNKGAHDMAIVMIMGKLARIATGVPHADNYDDIIGYVKIAKEHGVPSED